LRRSTGASVVFTACDILIAAQVCVVRGEAATAALPDAAATRCAKPAVQVYVCTPVNEADTTDIVCGIHADIKTRGFGHNYHGGYKDWQT